MHRSLLLLLLCLAVVGLSTLLVEGQSACGGAADPLIMYTAVLLPKDQRLKLLKAYPPIHENIYAQHMTMLYQPCTAQLCDASLTPWGQTVTLTVLGNQSDAKGQAVAVSPSPCVYSQNNYTHVTISCAHGVSAVYSNTLLEQDGYIPAPLPYLTLVGTVAGYAYNGTWLFANPSSCSQS